VKSQPQASPSNALKPHLAGRRQRRASARDNFIVPEESWNLEQLWVYAYQPDLAGSSLPIASATARIWYGNPAAGGQVVWGDSTTNRLVNATATNIATQKLFLSISHMRLKCSRSIILSATITKMAAITGIGKYLK
jgi:hypothetical protein